MKRIMILSLAAFLAAATTTRAEDTNDGKWMTDLPKALEKAKEEEKLVLVDFTGSDWCGWCIKMKKDVLSKSEFEQYADENLVLVMVDFPRDKEMSADQKRANAALKDKYSVQGFPTFVVLDQEGEEIGRQVGYSRGGPQGFIKKIEGFREE